jgi:hypothetical protein
MERPSSVHFDKEFSQNLYFLTIVATLTIFALFSYISYLAFRITANTEYVYVSYIIVSPVLVSIFLFALLLHIGKRGFYREVEHLKTFKHKL